ncbi:MAG: hypothetical protein EXQ52_18715, partial [Bryobacterales bacterium]|nr:hypothetical protein [Bryobacterales bacterium]
MSCQRISRRLSLRCHRLVAGHAALCLLLCAPLLAEDPQPPPRRETVVVTGVFEPVPLEDADRPVTVVDAKSLELLSGGLTD